VNGRLQRCEIKRIQFENSSGIVSPGQIFYHCGEVLSSRNKFPPVIFRSMPDGNRAIADLDAMDYTQA